MQTMRTPDGRLEVRVGYAADDGGKGVAYAQLSTGGNGLLRIGFRAARHRLQGEQDIGYAALTAVAKALAQRKFRDASFVIADRTLVDQIVSGRNVAEAFAIAYVRLRCALNALARFSVRVGPTDDLAQRARAEVALNVAA